VLFIQKKRTTFANAFPTKPKTTVFGTFPKNCNVLEHYVAVFFVQISTIQQTERAMVIFAPL